MAETNTSGNETSLKQIFQSMNTEGSELMEFTVISVSPLKMKATGDDKLIITERITVVPWHLTNYQTTVTIAWESDDAAGGSGEAAYASHSHPITGTKPITVNNALKVGEKVHVLSMNNGKRYYVLDRVAGQVVS